MKEVYPGIFMVTEPAGFFGLRDSVNLYILGGENGAVIDSGYPDRKSLKIFDRAYNSILKIYRGRDLPVNIDRIILSHSHQDHFSGLRALRRRYGFSIVATEAMTGYMSSMKAYMESYSYETPESLSRGMARRLLSRVSAAAESYLYKKIFSMEFISDPDLLIQPDTEIIIGGETWKIFPSPGHTDDHISLYNEAKGVLFAGDNVLKKITTWLGPPRSDLDDYIKTLETYRGLPGLKLILPAHGGIVTDPVQRIDELLKWRQKRADEILEIIRSRKSVSRKEIMKILYPAGLIRRYLGQGWIDLTLADLEKKGRVVSSYYKGNTYFTFS